MRPRADRRRTGGGDCQPARIDQGPSGREAAVRRNRLRRERREGGLLHRHRQPGAYPDSVRPGRQRIHGRPGGRARGDHSRRGALRRGDGHRDRSQDRAHRQSRIRRRVLRHGGAGIRSGLHSLLADWTHGGHGRRVGDHGGARHGNRAGPEGAPRTGRRSLSSRSTRCAPTTSISSMRGTRPPAGSSTPLFLRKSPATCSRSCSASPPTTPARISGHSSWKDCRDIRRLSLVARLPAVRCLARRRAATDCGHPSRRSCGRLCARTDAASFQPGRPLRDRPSRRGMDVACSSPSSTAASIPVFPD